tara:strand:+ start:1039 stop:1269 length:231 start_codon:yes stop_codon:yes gene_type:complete
MAGRVSLPQQIEEVERELAERERVYAGLDSRDPRHRSQRAYCMQRMVAVRRTLAWLERHERVLKQRCPEMFGGDLT